MYIVGTKYCCGNRKKIDLNLYAVIYPCYGERAFIVTNIKNCFCIKPQEFNLEDMNAQIRQWFGTCHPTQTLSKKVLRK